MSKAFLPGPGGRSFLFWCLLALQTAGIERVVFAVDTDDVENALWDLLTGEDIWTFRPDVFRDAGRGVHGIPWQARRRLDRAILFEAGHSVVGPAHYGALIDAACRESGTAVFSGFDVRAENPRFRVGLGERQQSLAHPMVIDRRYIDLLPRLGYDVDTMARHYLRLGDLRVVPAPDLQPVEFDVPAEYRDTMETLRRHAADCGEGTPWRGHPLPTERFEAVV